MRELLLVVAVLATISGSTRGQAVEPGSAPEITARPPGPIRVSSGVMAGLLVDRTMPVYPAEAKAAGVSGGVVLHAVVGKTGLVENLTVVSGPEMLRMAAMDAVRAWVYKPYLLNGEPTAVDTTVTINFSLAERLDSSSGSGSAAPIEGQAGYAREMAPPTPVRLMGQGPIRISGGVLQGLLEEKVDPIYPQSRDSGAVVMKVRVSREGEVTDVIPISGPESLRAASIEAVKQWSYRPYLLNGEPMEVDSTVTVMFTRQ